MNDEELLHEWAKELAKDKGMKALRRLASHHESKKAAQKPVVDRGPESDKIYSD